MASSLSELNDFNNETSLTYTDIRIPQIIFSQFPATDQSQTVNEGATFEASVGIGIDEFVNGSELSFQYTISVVGLAGTTISWPSLPPTVTLNDSTPGVYTITGITSAYEWDLVKAPNIILPPGAPNSFAGNWSYISTISYVDGISGLRTYSWTTGVTVLDVVKMTNPLSYVYPLASTSTILYTPQIIDLDTEYPNAVWTINGSVSNAGSLTSIGNTATGGTFTYNNTNKTFVISGTRTQVNARLNGLTITSNSNTLDFILTYQLTNNLDASVETKEQPMINSSNEFMSSAIDTVYYNEDQVEDVIINGTPLITDSTYTGTGNYYLTVEPSNAGAYGTLLTTGIGGITEFNETTKVLEITGKKAEVNSHLNTLYIDQMSRDFESNFSFTYTLITPENILATKIQSVICLARHDDVSNMNISRSYIANRKNMLFANDTPQITDEDPLIVSRDSINITSYGNAKLSTAVKKFGDTSVYLDGATDAVLFDQPSKFAGTGSFTWEGQFYIQNTRIANTIVNTGVELSTTTKKFGAASANFGVGEARYGILVENALPETLANDYTIEFWIFVESSTSGCVFEQILPDGYFERKLSVVDYQGSKAISINRTGSETINYLSPLLLNQWNHIAISRSNNVTKYYLNGDSQATFSGGTVYYPYNFVIGSNSIGDSRLTGYLKEFHIANTGLYTTDFTPVDIADVGNYTTIHLPFSTSDLTEEYSPNTINVVTNFTAQSDDIDNVNVAYFNSAIQPVNVNKLTITTPILESNTNDFTIEYWINSSVSSGWIFDGRPLANDNNYAPMMLIYESKIAYHNGKGLAIVGTTLPINVWNHVALVRYNGITKIYLNGAQSGSSIADTNAYNNSQFIIGQSIEGYGFTGYLDDFRVSDKARYTGNFTAPTAAFTTDANTTLLLSNDAGSVTTDTGKGYIYDEDIALLDTNGFGIYITNGRLAIFQSNTFVYFSGTWKDNTWQHIAVTKSGSTYKAYQNGNLLGTVTGSSSISCNELKLGIASDKSSDAFKGYIDEFRISNAVRYTANFNAPITEFSNDTNTLVLCHFNGANNSTTFEDDAYAEVFTIILSTDLGTWEYNGTHSTNFSFSGTKYTINEMFNAIGFYPYKGVSSNGTFTYTQQKNSITQFTTTLSLLGTFEPWEGNLQVYTYTSSGFWTPTWEQVRYGGKVDIIVVGGGSGGSNGQTSTDPINSSWQMAVAGSGGSGGVVSLQLNHAITQQEYTIIVGSGGAINSPGQNSSAFGYTAAGGTLITQEVIQATRNNDNNTITYMISGGKGGTSGGGAAGTSPAWAEYEWWFSPYDDITIGAGGTPVQTFIGQVAGGGSGSIFVLNWDYGALRSVTERFKLSSTRGTGYGGGGGGGYQGTWVSGIPSYVAASSDSATPGKDGVVAIKIRS